MKFEQGKLYRVSKVKSDYRRDQKFIYKVMPESLPLAEPGEYRPIEVDLEQGHELKKDDLFMFLQYELAFAESKSNDGSYLVVVYNEAVWTTNSPWECVSRLLEFEKVG